MQLIIERPAKWPSIKDEKYAYLISPASGSSEQEVKEMAQFLKGHNIEPILFDFPHENKELFLAQSDELRLEELKSALYGEKSSFILSESSFKPESNPPS